MFFDKFQWLKSLGLTDEAALNVMECDSIIDHKQNDKREV